MYTQSLRSQCSNIQFSLFLHSQGGITHDFTELMNFSQCYSFTRAQVALDGQEDQDANFDQDNYIFFLSGNTTGKVVVTCMYIVCLRVHHNSRYIKVVDIIL